MAKTVKCRAISKGIGEGEALVCHQPIGFNFGVDVPNGVIIEHHHELEGKSFKGKVLIFPHGKGSTGGSYVVYQVACEGTAPAAIINLNTETIIAVGAIMGKIPVVDHMEENPYDLIEDGDWVRVDAVNGTVTITKKGAQ
ncbi:aconitase X swivel domain-containing protein [Dysosmobacter sp.]